MNENMTAKTEHMIRYLVKYTKYTRNELERLDWEVLERWYKQEREIDKAEAMFPKKKK